MQGANIIQHAPLACFKTIASQILTLYAPQVKINFTLIYFLCLGLKSLMFITHSKYAWILCLFKKIIGALLHCIHIDITVCLTIRASNY